MFPFFFCCPVCVVIPAVFFTFFFVGGETCACFFPRDLHFLDLLLLLDDDGSLPSYIGVPPLLEHGQKLATRSCMKAPELYCGSI